MNNRQKGFEIRFLTAFSGLLFLLKPPLQMFNNVLNTSLLSGNFPWCCMLPTYSVDVWEFEINRCIANLDFKFQTQFGKWIYNQKENIVLRHHLRILPMQENTTA